MHHVRRVRDCLRTPHRSASVTFTSKRMFCAANESIQSHSEGPEPPEEHQHHRALPGMIMAARGNLFTWNRYRGKHGLPLPLPLLLLLLLLLPGSAFCPPPRAAPAPASRVLAASAEGGAEDGAQLKGRGVKKHLVVVIGDRSTRLYDDLWAPGSVSIQHPEDQRFLEVRGLSLIDCRDWIERIEGLHLLSSLTVSATAGGAAPATASGGHQAASRRGSPRWAAPAIPTSSAPTSAAWRRAWRRARPS